jgi:hypothetical protein
VLRRAAAAALWGALAACGLLALAARGGGSTPVRALAMTPTAYAYAPLLLFGPTPYACPLTSTNNYTADFAIQWDQDDPVRPAYLHADKNIELRGYTLYTGTLKRELVNYGSDDPTQPPQFTSLFDPNRVPTLTNFYRVGSWSWARSPSPGTRGAPITSPKITALGLATTPGERIRVPKSGYDIGGGMEVLLLFADEDTVALRYTREDSSGSNGYTVHIDNICTDPNLLALYNTHDRSNGPRYVYRYRGYCCYDLPNLRAGRTLGRARGSEVVVAISDTGTFWDPRSCNEWWQERAQYGYTGTCPAHD